MYEAILMLTTYKRLSIFPWMTLIYKKLVLVFDLIWFRVLLEALFWYSFWLLSNYSGILSQIQSWQGVAIIKINIYLAQIPIIYAFVHVIQQTNTFKGLFTLKTYNLMDGYNLVNIRLIMNLWYTPSVQSRIWGDWCRLKPPSSWYKWYFM